MPFFQKLHDAMLDNPLAMGDGELFKDSLMSQPSQSTGFGSGGLPSRFESRAVSRQSVAAPSLGHEPAMSPATSTEVLSQPSAEAIAPVRSDTRLSVEPAASAEHVAPAQAAE